MTNAIVKYSPEDLKRIGHGLVKQTKAGMKRAGQLLAKAAKESADKEFATRVASRVEEMIRHRSNLYISLDKTQREIAFYDRRLAAIEAGEIKVSFSGEIQYNDNSLQNLNLGEIHG